MEKPMRYYLAPMEGLTTYIFRSVWNRYYGGMDQYFTPFLCNRHMSSREKNDILPEHNQGLLTIPQILTNRAEEFLDLAAQLADYGYDTVNLNLGCPSGTVVSKNRGAGFLRYPEELDRFLEEIFSKAPCRISIKTRIGMEQTEEWDKLVSIYEKYPLTELIVHPRLQKEGYSGTPHMEAYGLALSRLPYPVCYNGDLTSREKFQSLCERFPRTDRVMIGRGILQNPGLLQQLKKEPEASRFTLRSFHDTLLGEYRQIMSGDTNTLYKMKDLWTFLIQSFPNSERYLKKIKKAKRITEYQAIVTELFTNEY